MGIALRVVVGLLVAAGALSGCSDDSKTTDPPASQTPEPTSASTPTPTPTPSADPKATAVAAAKARYLSAVAARTRAVQNPGRATETRLVAGGVADPWLGFVLDTIAFYQQNKLYETGAFKVTSMHEIKVVLSGEQPEVQFDVCGDNRSVQVRYAATGKAAERAQGTKLAPRFRATVRYAAATSRPGKNWYVAINEVVGSC